MTPTELREFQASHCDHLGQPLKVDGDLGPKTRWALAFERLPAERRIIGLRAQRYQGLREKTPNVDQYGLIALWLELCMQPPGQSYCAAWASHCLASIWTASAQQLGKAFVSCEWPQCADLVWWPTSGWQGHVEIVAGADRDRKLLMTWGANVDNQLGCWLRPYSPLMRFSRVMQRGADLPVPGIVDTQPVRLARSLNEGTR